MTGFASEGACNAAAVGSTISGRKPKNGNAAEPGFNAVAPGSGVIMTPPVSVCHQVSTIGQRRSPTTRWYHSHASGLIGSPTDPSRPSEARLVRLTGSSPAASKERIAVGAGWKTLTLYLSITTQNRDLDV